IDATGMHVLVLEALRGVRAVAKASVLQQQADRVDGSAPEAAAVASGAESSLPEGTYTYQVEGTPGLEIRPEVAAAIIGSGHELLEMKGLRLSLEDIFLRAIAQGVEQDEEEEYSGEHDEYEGQDETEEAPEREARKQIRERAQ